MSNLREQAYRAAYETLPHSEGFDWDRDGGLLAQAGTRREIQRGVDAALAVVIERIEALQVPFASSDLDHGYNRARVDVLALFKENA